MTGVAVVVLVLGLLLVAVVAGAALLAQQRRDRRPASGPRLRPRAATPTPSPAPAPVVRPEPPAEPITTRTAQADPPTVNQVKPLFGEGERHPTPPPHGGNGRAP